VGIREQRRGMTESQHPCTCTPYFTTC
jgi:hypothetical protein